MIQAKLSMPSKLHRKDMQSSQFTLCIYA